MRRRARALPARRRPRRLAAEREGRLPSAERSFAWTRCPCRRAPTSRSTAGARRSSPPPRAPAARTPSGAGRAAGWAAIARLADVPSTPFVRDSFDRAVDEIERGVRERAPLRLADAQLLIARAHGFATWAELARHVERASDDPFEAAADAVVTGDVGALEALVRAHRGLARARSPRVHRATLLHYVAANGVEDFRQRTPPNAVAVARLLLDARAAVDAVAETYGGGSAQTTLNLLVSAHPAEAGLQSELVELLLDAGAAIDGLDDDGSPIMTALAFGYGGAAETLARRGARLDVVAAAAVGREDLVRRFAVDGSTLSAAAPDAKARLELALAWAARFGRLPVVEFLLERGVDPAAGDGDAMTALHWAAANGHADVIEALLRRRAPLEVVNRWGGTVLDSTAYFAVHAPAPGVDYGAVLARLLAAGADPRPAAWAAGDPRVGDVLPSG